MARTVSELAPEYERLLRTMKVKPAWKAAVDRAARFALAHRRQYEGIQQLTGVPWDFIAALHWRESANDEAFQAVLHNGEKIIGKRVKTTLEPAGRGPFQTWTEAALDALRIKGLDKIGAQNWTWAMKLFQAERFNGWGYRNIQKPSPSPYLWSGSEHYQTGKFYADGKYSSTIVDKQVGVATVMKRIQELEIEETLKKTSRKVGMMVQVRAWAQRVAAAAGTVFTLDNLGVFTGWLSPFAGLGSYALVAGAAILGYWVLSNFIIGKTVEDVKEDRYQPSGLQTTEGHASDLSGPAQ